MVKRIDQDSRMWNIDAAVEPTLFDLAALLRRAAADVKSRSRAHGRDDRQGIVFDLSLTPGCVVKGDREKMLDALTALMEISARSAPYNGVVSVDTTVRSGRVTITVRDRHIESGASGYEPLISPFRLRGSTSGEKSLSMIYAVVTAHRGAMSMDIRSGHGTTFIVELPFASSAGDAQGCTTDPIAPRKKSVLVIDPSESTATSLKAVLGKRGHAVLKALTTGIALELVQRVQIDFLIWSRDATDANGRPIVDDIIRLYARHGLPRPYVIAVSNEGPVKEPDSHGLRAEVDAHLHKPIDPASVLELVEKTPLPGWDVGTD